MDIHRKIWSFSTKKKLTPSHLVDNKTKIKTSQIEKRVWIGLEVKVALIASHRSQVPPPPNSAIGRTTENWNSSFKFLLFCLLSLGSAPQIIKLKRIYLALWLLLLTQCCDSEELIFYPLSNYFDQQGFGTSGMNFTILEQSMHSHSGLVKIIYILGNIKEMIIFQSNIV